MYVKLEKKYKKASRSEKILFDKYTILTNII